MITILEIESSKGWGGQEKRTVRLVEHLDKNRFRVLWAVEAQSKLYAKKNEITGTFYTFALNRIYNLKTIWKLCKFVKREKVDIISTHSGKDAWIGNIVGKLTNTKVVRVRHLIVPIKNAASYNLADRVVTVSKQVKDALISQGVDSEKIVTIYTGIDTHRFQTERTYDLREALGLEPSTMLVGIVAVLRRAKRHQELIETFVKIPGNAKLVIVGDGPQRENLENLIEKLGVKERVIMLGHREDIDKMLPNFDMFVLPSEHEALGTSLLEAQSCGVPVLASNTGGIPEALDEGRTGYLFNDFNELEQRLVALMDNKALLDGMKRNCRPFIEEKFSVEKMVSYTQKLYEELVEK